MRALGYFRADAATQSEVVSKTSEDAEREFFEYCDLNLHQPVEFFGDLEPPDDVGYPGYSRLLSFISGSGSNFLVAVPDASHLGEDLESVARAFLEVEKAGAKVACQDQDLPDPLQSAFAVLGVAGVSRARSAKIRSSMQNKAILGKGLGRPPFGYRNGEDGTLEIVREEAAVVELIFRLYTKDEMGMRLIVQHLNERGITTRRGGRWNVVSVRDILKNPAYIGTYTRFGLRLPGSHDPIVPPAVYRAARDIVRRRRPLGRISMAEPFLLSGIAFCDYCGNRMMGVTRRQRWRNKDGNRNRKTYRYYQCQSRNNQSVCGYHTWREADLEGAVLAQIPLAVRARKLQRQTSEDDGSESRLRRIRNERIRNAEHRFIQAMRKTAAGAAKTDRLEQAIGELDRARKNAQQAERPTDVGAVLSRWEDLGFDQKRDFLLTHVGRVEVRDHMATVSV